MRKLSKILNLMIALGIGVTGFIFWKGYELHEKTKALNVIGQTNQSSLSPSNQEQLVSKYMQDVQDNLRKQKMDSAFRIRKNGVVIVNKGQQSEVDPLSIPVSKQIWKDPATSKLNQQTLTERFDEQVFDEKREKLEEEQYRKEAARQIIENARKDGYAIKLSDSLEVMSVVPIRKPQNDQDFFESHPSN